MKAWLKRNKKWLGIIGLGSDILGTIFLLFFYKLIPFTGFIRTVDPSTKLAIMPESDIFLNIGFTLLIFGFLLLLIKEAISD